MKKLLALVLAMLMAVSMINVAYAANTDSNLVAHWTFDNEDMVVTDGVASVVYDKSGNGFDVNVTDAEHTIVDGFNGNSIYFKDVNTESGTLQKPRFQLQPEKLESFVSEVNGKSGMTVSVMAKRTAYGSSQDGYLFNFAPNNVAVFRAYSRNTRITNLQRSTGAGASLQVHAEPLYNASGNVTEFNPTVITAAATANATAAYNRYEWQNITMVADYANKKYYVYVDGVLVGDFAASMYSTKSNFTATAEGYLKFGSCCVMLDDVKVFNKALSANEVKQNIEPVMEYTFDSMTNNVVANERAKAANITLPEGATAVEGAVNSSVKLSGKGTIPAGVFNKNVIRAKAISVSAWIKSNDGKLTTNTSGQALFQEASIGGFNMALVPSGQVRIGGRSQAPDAYGSITTNSVVFTEGDTDWHHIAGTIDIENRTAYIYVDGVLDNTVVFTDSAAFFQSRYYNITNASKVDYLDLNNTADVTLDELKLYRRALTASEVALEYKKVYGLNVDADFTVNADSVAASCNVANTTGKTVDASLILGMYNKHTNELLKLDIVDVNGLATDTVKQETITLSNINTPSDYKYKLFVWDGVDTLKPYQLVEQYNK